MTGTNPYWHPEVKPHAIDRGEIEGLCFRIYNLIWAAANRSDDNELPTLSALQHRMAEPELSRLLLQLGILVRVFDDVFSTSDDPSAYQIHRQAIDDASALGAVYEGKVALTVRELSNKIIHAEDVRPVYESEDVPAADGEGEITVWRMTSEIELGGRYGKNEWLLSLNTLAFLEAVLDLVAFGALQELGSE